MPSFLVRVSPAALRTIDEAFQDLKRTISDKDQAGFAGITLDKVFQAAHDIEEQLAARQLLRNMRRLVPLFDGLRYYHKSIEVACNGTPYMPWIWAPITVILKIASDYVNAFDKLIVAYARIAEPLARFKILHETYPNNIHLQEVSAMFFSDILKFHKEAYKFVRRSGWKVFFMTTWGRFQRRFDNIVGDLKAHEQLVDATANALGQSVGQSELRRIKEQVEKTRREALEKVVEEEKERTTSHMVAYVHDQFLRKKTRVTQLALERIILEVIGAISDNPTHTRYVHVVLNGLEECEKEKEDKIIKHLGRMEAAALRSASAVCKVLVSSRMPSSVAKTLSGKHVISLSNEKEAITTAIATYTSKRLVEVKEKMELTDLEVEGVKSRLHEVMDAVDTLPRELSELFVSFPSSISRIEQFLHAEMLTQIITLFDKRSVSRLRSILAWIAFAKRPLRGAELRSALSFSEEKGDVNVQELAPNYIFDKCKPIIEEKADTTFAFIHVSVKEYVHSKRCIATFKSGSSTAEQSLRVVRGLHGLHLYASEYWVEYLLYIAASDNDLKIATAFFDQSRSNARFSGSNGLWLRVLPKAENRSLDRDTRNLAQIINSFHSGPNLEPDDDDVDSRLVHLEEIRELWAAARSVTSRRTVKSVSSKEGGCSQDCDFEVKDLASLLLSYQHIIRGLLKKYTLPGVSAQEFERFKEDFLQQPLPVEFHSVH
ncbi:NACHT domain protein [Colletotrichum plurivorum]|uniref:NACHT domain protein n=1 Tax=Colletotrichum plurivorum TaxID=2175906 RepID=A0A8H6K525_9PEZI|nr:NACHT domain protein [Colletotrichum plurivorum]